MPHSNDERMADGDRANALTGAVACLDEMDARLAERCSPTVLQDVVGNLLLILSRMQDADRADDSSTTLADCRALAIESLILAGVPQNRIEAAIAAVSLVEGITPRRNATPD